MLEAGFGDVALLLNLETGRAVSLTRGPDDWLRWILETEHRPIFETLWWRR